MDVMAQRAVSVTDPVILGMNDGDQPLYTAHGYVNSVDEPWIDAVLNLKLAADSEKRITADVLRDHQVMRYAAKSGAPAMGSPRCDR
ncbi:MAG: hypothetical protein AAFT19_01495 [Pseudomonadota bacterium]